MKDINEFDFNLIDMIPNAKRKSLKIIPVYKKEKFIYCVGDFNEKEEIKYLNYLYGNEIKELKSDENIFNLLKDNIELDINEIEEEKIIIEKAIEKNGSDIHFEPHENYVKVRVRINGELITFYKMRSNKYKEVISRIKIKSNMDMTEKRFPQDGKFVFENNELKYSIRTSTIPTVYGEKLALRILYKNNNYNLEKLGLNKDQLDRLKEIIKVNRGMVLINGPTGSGKSTSLYTILDKIKCENLNITTIEDPVEITIENINQISLDRKAGLGFAEGLRSILRQDPDVIMIGEIRDEETAQIAVRAAITGHKVYSTIHTKSSKEVFTRLEEMGVKKYLINDAIVGLISQRLVKTICPNCRKEVDIEINGISTSVYEENGCKECNYTGIKGRSLVSAVHFVKEGIKFEEFSNGQMKERVNDLLRNGVIGRKEYTRFLEGEDF